MPGYTQFFLNTAGPPYTLTGAWHGSWNVDGFRTIALDGTKFGAENTSTNRFDTSSTSPYDVGVVRGVSRQLAPQTITGTMDVVVGVNQSNVAADFYHRVYAYIFNVTDDSVLGVLLNYSESSGSGTEWPTTSTGTSFASPQTLSNVTVPDDGKEYCLVAELGVRSYNSVTTAYSATIRYGAKSSTLADLSDLTVGSTSTGTLAGFLQFSNAIQLATIPQQFGHGEILIPGSDIVSNVYDVATVISATDGATVRKWPELPFAETGDVLPFGIFAITAQSSPGDDVATIDVFGADNSPIASIPVTSLHAGAWYAFSPIRSDRYRTFYVMRIRSGGSPAAPTLHTISHVGTIGAQSWTMPASAGDGGSAMAPSRDGSKVYFAYGNGVVVQSSGIGRYDLINDVELAALVPAAAGLTVGRDLFVTAEGHILVNTIQSPATNWIIKRYSDDGTVVASYPLPAGSDSDDEIEMGIDPSDESAFWVRTYPSSTTSRFFRFRISDGATLSDYTITRVDGGGTTLVPQSCPLLIYPRVIPVRDLSVPCCRSKPPKRLTSTQPLRGTAGRRSLPPVDSTWVPACEGGGTVPSAPDPVDAERWD